MSRAETLAGSKPGPGDKKLAGQKKLGSLEFQVKNKQEIKALARQGQQAYDELARQYIGEKDRQQAAFEERAA